MKANASMKPEEEPVTSVAPPAEPLAPSTQRSLATSAASQLPFSALALELPVRANLLSDGGELPSAQQLHIWLTQAIEAGQSFAAANSHIANIDRQHRRIARERNFLDKALQKLADASLAQTTDGGGSTALAAEASAPVYLNIGQTQVKRSLARYKMDFLSCFNINVM